MTAILVIIILVAVFAATRYSFQRKSQKLTATRPGVTRVVIVKASLTDLTVRQYTTAGWSIVDQSSSKSFASQPRVTITFRKN